MRHQMNGVIKDIEPLQESRHRWAVIKIKRDCLETIFWMISYSPTHSRNRWQRIHFTHKQYLYRPSKQKPEIDLFRKPLASSRGLAKSFIVFMYLKHGVSWKFRSNKNHLQAIYYMMRNVLWYLEHKSHRRYPMTYYEIPLHVIQWPSLKLILW